MQPVASIWYGVDPLTEEYTEISGYVYCHANPVRLIDPDGNGDKDDGSAISVTLSLGWQIGFKIGRFGMDIDFGSTNLKCIVGVSFEADFKTLYKKGASAVTDFGRQAVKESKKAINNGVQVVKNLWDSFTSLF